MATQKSKAVTATLETKLERGRMTVCLVGESPLISNAMSLKVMKELIFPSARKNSAEKASTLKHDPMAEYRLSMYRARSTKAPTEIVLPSVIFKKSMMSAGVDMPGTNKSQMGRLTYVSGDQVCIWGIPEMLMSVVKQAGINGAPDVRTRAILPRWATTLEIVYTMPLIKQVTVQNMLAAAGITQGVGDYRIQKGAGNYGGFKIVSVDDPQFQEIVAEGGREAQLAAIEEPAYYDSETQNLMSWFESEVKRRGFKVA